MKEAQKFGFTANGCNRNLKLALNHYWQAKELGIHVFIKHKLRRTKAAYKTSLKNTIVENYGNPDYSFITTPPGYSEWGTYLGRQQIGYMDTMLPQLEGKSVLEIGSGSLYIADYFVEHNKVKQFVACDPVLRKEKSRGTIKVVANYFSYEAFKDRYGVR